MFRVVKSLVCHRVSLSILYGMEGYLVQFLTLPLFLPAHLVWHYDLLFT